MGNFNSSKYRIYLKENIGFWFFFFLLNAENHQVKKKKENQKNIRQLGSADKNAQIAISSTNNIINTTISKDMKQSL